MLDSCFVTANRRIACVAQLQARRISILGGDLIVLQGQAAKDIGTHGLMPLSSKTVTLLMVPMAASNMLVMVACLAPATDAGAWSSGNGAVLGSCWNTGSFQPGSASRTGSGLEAAPAGTGLEAAPGF